MTAQLQQSIIQAATGALELDGETLVGIVVKDTYVFSAAHELESEVDAFEVEPASLESRLTGVAAATLTDGATGWLVTITGTTPLDLSDVADRGGIIWLRPGSPGFRKIIGFCEDIGAADATYLPTWPDGLFFDAIASLDADLAALESRTVAGVAFDDTGDVPADDLAEALGVGAGGGSDIADFTPIIYDGVGTPVDLNGGRAFGRYQMITPSLCWWEAWVFIEAGGTPGVGGFSVALPVGAKQDPPVGGEAVLRQVATVIAIRGTPFGDTTGKCIGAVTGGDLSTAAGLPPGTIPAVAAVIDNVGSPIDEGAQAFGWTTEPDGDGFPFDWCVEQAFLKFTGTYEIEPT